MNHTEELIKRYNNTNDSKLIELIIKENIDLINQTIKYIDSSLTYDELFCFGLEALYKAIKTYNPKLGSFKGYAIICIRNELLREIGREANFGIIFYPTFYKAKKVIEKEELDTLEENNLLIDNVFKYLEDNKILSKSSSLEHKKHFLSSLKHYIDDYTIVDDTPVESEIEYKEICEIIDKILSILGSRNKEILKLYFGLYGGKSLTYDELALSFKLSRSRVGQIINNSLKTLSESKYNEELLDFLHYFDQYNANKQKKLF